MASNFSPNNIKDQLTECRSRCTRALDLLINDRNFAIIADNDGQVALDDAITLGKLFQLHDCLRSTCALATEISTRLQPIDTGFSNIHGVAAPPVNATARNIIGHAAVPVAQLLDIGDDTVSSVRTEISINKNEHELGAVTSTGAESVAAAAQSAARSTSQSSSNTIFTDADINQFAQADAYVPATFRSDEVNKITVVESPIRFYGMKDPAAYAKMDDELQSLGESIADMRITAPFAGQPCMARYREDNRYYRARVETVGKNEATVLYVDYGNCETVPHGQLLFLPKMLATQPCFAIPMKLDGMDSRKLSSDIVDRFRKSLGEGDRVMVKPMTRKHDGRWRVLLFAIDGEQWVVGDRTPKVSNTSRTTTTTSHNSSSDEIIDNIVSAMPPISAGLSPQPTSQSSTSWICQGEEDDDIRRAIALSLLPSGGGM